MFAFLGPESVGFIDQSGDVVTFRSAKRRSPGTKAKVRFDLNVNGKPSKMDLQVYLVTVRPIGTTPGFLCVGKLGLPEAQLKSTVDALTHFAMRGNLGIAARRSPRLLVSLRVLSRELPGFGAVTVDVSAHGAQLSTHGPVAVGTRVNFTLELDVASVGGNLHLSGRVIWCRATAQSRGCLAGIEYQDLDPATLEVLEKYTKGLAERQRSDVMQRTIGDADVFTRTTDNISKNT
jgi:hypothetical protein